MKRLKRKKITVYSSKNLILLSLGLILGLGLVYIYLVSTKNASAAWYHDSWGYRRKLTIDNTQVSGSSDLTNFPVMVSFTSDTNLSANAKADGSDILFVDAKGASLVHEIEYYASGTLIAWVQIPTLSTSVDTVIYMYYGNPIASGLENETAVWASDYRGVWHLAETSGQHLDSTSNNNDSTTVNVAAQGSATGKIGGASDFASGNEVIMADSNSLDISGSFTAQAWVKADSIGGSGTWNSIIYKGGNSNYFLEFTNTDEIDAGFYGGGDWRSLETTTSPVSTGTFYHVAVVHDSGADSLKVYVNGVEKGTASGFTQTPLTNTSTFTIGENYYNETFDGIIDEVRLSDAAKTVDWLLTEYNNQNAPSTFYTANYEEERTRGPAAYWKFDEGYGTSVNDSSGNTIVGTMGTGSSAPTWTTEDRCLSGKCIQMDGGDDYLSYGDNLDVADGQDFTFTAWIKSNSYSTVQTVLAKKLGNSAGQGGYLINIGTGGTLNFYAADGTDQVWKGSSTVMSTNTWYHIAFVFDEDNASNIAFYINGSPTSGNLTGTLADINSLANAQVLGIGVEPDAQYVFNGFIDEVKFYPYARSADEIKQDYLFASAKGAAVVLGAQDQSMLSDGLVGYWKLDESSSGECSVVIGGTTYIDDSCDSSGNNNSGFWAGDVAGTAGRYGNGALFDGVGDEITIPDTANLRPSRLTISFWANTSSLASNDQKAVTKGATSSQETFILGPYYGSWRFVIRDTAYSIYPLTAGTAIGTSTWEHVTATYDGDYMRIYLNGELSNSVQIGDINLSQSVTDLGVGGPIDSGSYNYSGILDELRIYNRAFSAAEVKALYNWAPGTVGYWSLNENQGSVANDQSGNANTATLESTPTWSSGKFGSALRFDGTNDYVSVPDSTTLTTTNDFSVDFWFRPGSVFNSTSTYVQGLIDRTGYRIFLDKADGKLKADIHNSNISWTTAYDGSQEAIYGLAAYGDNLYAGQGTGTGDGDVLVYDGSSWTTSYDGAQERINAIAVYDGKLYAGQGTGAGDGDVLVYDGNSWTTSYDGSENVIYALGVYNGKLYAGVGSGAGDGDILVFDGSSWTTSYDGAQEAIESFAVYDGLLYAGQGSGSGDGDVLVFDGTSWSVAFDGTTSNIWALLEYNGELYVAESTTGTVGTGQITKFDGSSWTTVYDSATVSGAMSLGVYNGYLYSGLGMIGSAGTGDIIRYDGSSWTTVYDGSEDYIRAFATYEGKLYVGQATTSNGVPIGDVLLLDSGQQVVSAQNSWDEKNWYHISLTKKNTDVYLYVDGSVSGNLTLSSSAMNINPLPLLIGKNYGYAGSAYGDSHFSGYIDEVQLFNYSRSQSQILETMNAGHPLIGTPVGSTTVHLKFDEGYGTIANDSSSQGNSGSLAVGSSSPSWTNDGKMGKALSFDGGDYVTFGDNDDLKLTFPFTVSAWVNISELPVDEYTIISKYYALTNDREWAFQIINGSNLPRFVVSSNGTANELVYANTAFTAGDVGSWVHLMITADENGEYTFYRNGKADGTGTFSTTTVHNDTAHAMIGAVHHSSGSPSRYFKGMLDEVSMYPFNLTSDQVSTVYNGGKTLVLGTKSTGIGGTTPSNSSSREYCVPGDTSSCVSPIAEWKYDEGAGTGALSIKDTSGNESHLSSQGSDITWKAGKKGKSVALNGGDNNICADSNGDSTCDADASFQLTGNMTFQTWIKPVQADSVTDLGTIVYEGYWGAVISANNTLYGLTWDVTSGGNSILYSHMYGTGSEETHTFDFPLVSNSWQHIAFTRDISTNTVSFYGNGVLIETWTYTNDPSDGSAAVLRFGDVSNNSSLTLQAEYDDTKIYNYARTSAQIAWDYDRGTPVGWYKFDECQGTTAYNSALSGAGKAAGNNGTISIGGGGENTVGNCSTSSTSWGSGADGKTNSSLDFDGTDDYVDMGDPSSGIFDPGTGDYSVSVWMKGGTQTNTSSRLVFKYQAIHVNANHTGICANKISFEKPSGSVGLCSTSDVNDNAWHLVTAVRKGDNAYVYIDGKLENSQAGWSSENAATNYSLTIGGYPSANHYFDGQIDDVRIYRYALTSNQVKQVYNNGAVSFK